MNWSEINGKLFDGILTPLQAKQEAYQLWEEECLLALKRWLPHKHDIMRSATDLLDYAQDVVERDYYSGCVKAAFFADFFSSKEGGLVTEIESTQPPWNGFDCTMGTGNRDSGRRCNRIETCICGDRYDNCPSVHAAQWLKRPVDCRDWELLWLEAGAVINPSGHFELANADISADKPKPYRCSMCLKSVLGQGVNDLCNIGADAEGNPVLHFQPITATLNYRIIANCADMLAERPLDARRYAVV